MDIITSRGAEGRGCLERPARPHQLPGLLMDGEQAVRRRREQRRAFPQRLTGKEAHSRRLSAKKPAPKSRFRLSTNAVHDERTSEARLPRSGRIQFKGVMHERLAP